MKITIRQLKKLINEVAHSGEEELTDEQTILDFIRNGELRSAESFAESLEIDLFPLVAQDWRTLDAIFEDMIDEQAMIPYLEQVADNSFEGDSLFNALLYVLPTHPTLSLGMSYEEILELINNDPQRYNYYKDTYKALGINWPNFLSVEPKINVDVHQFQNFVKDWIAGIMFLKLESMYNSSSGEFSISDALDAMRAT